MIAQDWNAVAGAWDAHFEWNARCFAPLVDWFARSMQLSGESRVLDVACGAGFPALQMAQRVAPHGSITGVDASPVMIDAADQRARAWGLANVDFRVMDAQALQFPDASFDAVTLAFGLMLMPESGRAVAEIRRVLKPGGRFAIAVWGTPADNPFLAIFGRAAVDVGVIAPPVRTDPGPFRLSAPGELERALRAGGLNEFVIESLPMPIEYESIDDYLAKSKAMAPGAAVKLRDASPDVVTKLDTLVRDAVSPFIDAGGGVHLPATPLCASGAITRGAPARSNAI